MPSMFAGRSTIGSSVLFLFVCTCLIISFNFVYVNAVDGQIHLNSAGTCLEVSDIDVCKLEATASALATTTQEAVEKNNKLMVDIQRNVSDIVDTHSNLAFRKNNATVQVDFLRQYVPSENVTLDDWYDDVWTMFDRLAKLGGGDELLSYWQAWAVVMGVDVSYDAQEGFSTYPTAAISSNDFAHEHVVLGNINLMAEPAAYESPNTGAPTMGGSNYLVVNSQYQLENGRIIISACTSAQTSGTKTIGLHVVEQLASNRYRIAGNLGAWVLDSAQNGECVYQAISTGEGTLDPFVVPSTGIYYIAVLQIGTETRGEITSSYYIALADLPGDDLALDVEHNMAPYGYEPVIGVVYGTPSPTSYDTSVAFTSPFPMYSTADIFLTMWISGPYLTSSHYEGILNTDLTVEVSWDHGATFTLGILRHGPKIYVGEFVSALVSVPESVLTEMGEAANNVVVRLSTLNGVEMMLHAVAVNYQVPLTWSQHD